MAVKYFYNFNKRFFASRDHQFKDIAKVFREVESESSRKSKQAIYTNFIEKLCKDKESLRDIVRMTIGLFQPRFNADFEMNVATAVIKESLSLNFGIQTTDIDKL